MKIKNAQNAIAHNALETETEVWCHLAPFGRFERPGHKQGEVVVQLCDQQAFEQLIASFRPELLVDFEHNSALGGDTVAAAWLSELRIDEDGLYGLLRFSDVGAESIRGRRYRYLSPTWTLGADARPEVLHSVALTNTPYFILRPILNKAAGDVPPPPTKDNTMQKIAALFGLDAEASEADIEAAAKAVIEKSTALQTRIEELEKTALEKEANEVADEEKEKIGNKAEFVKLYVADKEVTLALLKTIKKPAAPQPVTNSAKAKLPDAFMGNATTSNTLDIYDVMPAGAEKRAYLKANAEEINSLRNKRDNG